MVIGYYNRAVIYVKLNGQNRLRRGFTMVGGR